MTTYLVAKRMVEDRVYLPGEVLVDPENAEILRARGYLTIVPDDFNSPAPGAKVQPRRPTVEESLVAGYSQEAAEALANGTYDEDPEVKKMVDAETEAIDAAASKDPEDAVPTEAQLKSIVAGMQDVDLNAAIQTYEVPVPQGDEATREDQEAALVAWLGEHPEITTEDGESTIVPSDSERLGLNTDGTSVGAGGDAEPPEDDAETSKTAKKTSKAGK